MRNIYFKYLELKQKLKTEKELIKQQELFYINFVENNLQPLLQNGLITTKEFVNIIINK